MRYSKYRADTEPKNKELNPIWRGIGCILFVITPVIAVAIANVLLESGFVQRWIALPRNLLLSYTVPGLNWTITYFLASLALGAGVTVMLYAGYFVVYSAMYRMIGPPRYGPTDVPPVRSKGRVRKSR